MATEDFLPGDVVSVNVPSQGKREGLVIGTHLDTVGRQIVEIQFDRQEQYYQAWVPMVTRIRRYAGLPHSHYHHPYHQPTIQRQVHYY